MMKAEQDRREISQVVDPEEIAQLKASILKAWQRLPPETQAEVTVEQLREVMKGQLGETVRNELERQKEVAIPIVWVSKDDLLYCQPDLEEKAGELDEAEISSAGEEGFGSRCGWLVMAGRFFMVGVGSFSK